MSTNNAEKASFKITIGNEADKIPCNLRTMTLERVWKIIESKNYDSKVTAELKKYAAKYPQQALENFVHNFDKHLMKARKAVKLSKPTVSPSETLLNSPEVIEETQKQEDEIPNAPQDAEF